MSFQFLYNTYLRDAVSDFRNMCMCGIDTSFLGFNSRKHLQGAWALFVTLSNCLSAVLNNGGFRHTLPWNKKAFTSCLALRISWYKMVILTSQVTFQFLNDWNLKCMHMEKVPGQPDEAPSSDNYQSYETGWILYDIIWGSFYISIGKPVNHYPLFSDHASSSACSCKVVSTLSSHWHHWEWVLVLGSRCWMSRIMVN